MAITTTKWDVSEHLDSEEAIAAYLDAVLEDGDPALVVAALGDVAKARGMTEIAEKAGFSRAGLYKALGEGGNPGLVGLMGIMKALGVRLGATTGERPVETEKTEPVKRHGPARPRKPQPRLVAPA